MTVVTVKRVQRFEFYVSDFQPKQASKGVERGGGTAHTQGKGEFG
jgi:hypothetical protein